MRRKTCRLAVHQAADAFTSEIRRDAQARLLDKKLLHLVLGTHMLRPRQVVLRARQRLCHALVAVGVFVNVPDTILPEIGLPRGRGQLVLQHTRIAIERHHLRSLFLQRHAPQQIGDARLDIER